MRCEMKKALIALTATVPLALLATWTAKAYPIGNSFRAVSQGDLIEQIGCKGGPSREDRWKGLMDTPVRKIEF
jgi:hypothetical protein